MATIMEKDVLIEFASNGVAQMASTTTLKAKKACSTLNKLYRKLLLANPEDIDYNKTASAIKKLRNL